jgi:protein-S-isoprenylcysteine O-methyltransferase Ste14
LSRYRLLGARVINRVHHCVLWAAYPVCAPRGGKPPRWPLIGFCLVCWAISSASWSAGIIHKKKSLTDVGPYSVVRNRCKWGTFFISLGFGFLCTTLCLWILLLLPYVLIYPSPS